MGIVNCVLDDITYIKDENELEDYIVKNNKELKKLKK